MSSILLAFILFFQPVDSLTQSSAPIVLHDSMQVEAGGSLILSDLPGWEFSTSDPFDSTATPSWIALSQPVEEPDSLLKSLWEGYGWYRLSFRVDSSFSLRPAILSNGQDRYVALEIYLNGEMIDQIGSPSVSENGERLTSIYAGIGELIYLEPDKDHELIIFKSYHKSDLVSTLLLPQQPHPSQLEIGLFEYDRLIGFVEGNKTSIYRMASISLVLIILCFIYLGLYLKLREQKENLWLVLLMANILFVALSQVLDNFTIESFWPVTLFTTFEQLVYGTALTLIPLVTFKLLKVQAHFFWKAYVILGAALYLYDTHFTDVLGVFNLAGILVISISGGLYAIYKAYRQGNRDTLIPAISILGLPVTLITGITLNVFGLSLPGFLSSILLFLTLPIGLSLYQAKKFLRLHKEMDHLVDERTAELNQSLLELKAAQQQLVQQEKLASLGQLTAGIAHEIKNPLNFVNNFSDLNMELVEEAREMAKGDSELMEILNDIEANLKKIHEHGNRADGIVKSMLLHSRGGSGKMESANLNELVKEYVNLAFHGMRAGKDPINVDIQFDLGESVGEVLLIAEDFSRVLVNLCNNAFDALREKLKVKGETFTPTLIVRTSWENGKAIIEIEDNGPGIPEEIKDKIMQPFFTTKKGTEGTGLGLSITNDIIKAHGGQLDVKSSDSGSTFTITLPDN